MEWRDDERQANVCKGTFYQKIRLEQNRMNKMS